MVTGEAVAPELVSCALLNLPTGFCMVIPKNGGDSILGDQLAFSQMQPIRAGLPGCIGDYSDTAPASFIIWPLTPSC